MFFRQAERASIRRKQILAGAARQIREKARKMEQKKRVKKQAAREQIC